MIGPEPIAVASESTAFAVVASQIEAFAQIGSVGLMNLSV